MARNDCYNKNTELFMSDSFYFPSGMSVVFSKNCQGCSIRLLKGYYFNFYEVILSSSAAGKKVSLTISPK